MSEIQKLALVSKTIGGLKTRTNNSNEVNKETQRVAALWREFETKIRPRLENNEEVYAVYHHYDHDEHGEYDILIGSENLTKHEKLEQVTLEEGKYLMFPVKGELPQAIVETWKEIWHYFNDESVDERRDFKTDFELYTSKDEVEIYIGVNYF